MRLESMGAPDAGHGRGIGSQVLGQGAGAPVSRARGSLLQRDAHDLFDVAGFPSGARASWARGVLQQTVHAGGKKARSPARRNPAIGQQLLRDVLVRHAGSRQQNDARAHLNARFDALAIGKDLKEPIIVGTQLNRLGNSHGIDPQDSWR